MHKPHECNLRAGAFACTQESASPGLGALGPSMVPSVWAAMLSSTLAISITSPFAALDIVRHKILRAENSLL